MKDYLKGQRVVALIKLEDQHQDFAELDILENGVILGDSILFEDGRLSLVGIGTSNGRKWFGREDILSIQYSHCEENELLIYYKPTDTPTPLPWNCGAFKYRVKSVGKGFRADRFL